MQRRPLEVSLEQVADGGDAPLYCSLGEIAEAEYQAWRCGGAVEAVGAHAVQAYRAGPRCGYDGLLVGVFGQAGDGMESRG